MARGIAHRFPSLAARLTNSGRLAPRLAVRLTKLQARVYTATKGRVAKRWFGAPIIVLEVVGRKSGQLRATPLIRARHGDAFLVVPGNGGQAKVPAWWLNLEAAGEAVVIADGRRQAVRMRLAEGPELDEVLPIVEAAWPPLNDYRGLTTRDFPVAVLEPV